MDVGEGVEANLHVGRNGGQNQNIERGDEIAELRRQVASLAEVLQCMQPPPEGLLTLILILRILLEFLQGVGLMWKETSQGLTTTSRLKHGSRRMCG